KALCARGLDVLAHEVATGALLGRAEVCRLRVEVAEALVMFGRHHHVLLPGAACEARPLARGCGLRLELPGYLCVLGGGDTLHLHHPLVATEHAVEAPVYEHA